MARRRVDEPAPFPLTAAREEPARSLDPIAHAPTGRRRGAAARLRVGARRALQGWPRPRQDARRRRHDPGGQRRAPLDRAARRRAELRALPDGLAKASGIATPTRQGLARIDRKRPKKGSNDDWRSPTDPDAQIMKMKDARTRFAHKQEQAVDMDTGAVLGVTIAGGAEGETTTLGDTLEEADENLQEVRRDADDTTSKRIEPQIRELVADKGDHGNAVMTALEELEIRSYISEPARGRRNWRQRAAERDAVYRNRRRITGDRGKALLRRRGELLDRPWAGALESGGMRRTYLRRHDNILERRAGPRRRPQPQLADANDLRGRQTKVPPREGGAARGPSGRSHCALDRARRTVGAPASAFWAGSLTPARLRRVAGPTGRHLPGRDNWGFHHGLIACVRSR